MPYDNENMALNDILANFTKPVDAPAKNILNVPVPIEMRKCINKLCSIYPPRRLTAKQVIEIKAFDNQVENLVKTLSYTAAFPNGW